MVADREMPELLCRVNFPLYNVNMISPRHVMLGGGGGAAERTVPINKSVCVPVLPRPLLSSSQNEDNKQFLCQIQRPANTGLSVSPLTYSHQ